MMKTNLYKITQSIDYKGQRMSENDYWSGEIADDDVNGFEFSEVAGVGWFRMMASKEWGNHHAANFSFNEYVYRGGEETLIFKNAEECLAHQLSQTTVKVAARRDCLLSELAEAQHLYPVGSRYTSERSDLPIALGWDEGYGVASIRVLVDEGTQMVTGHEINDRTGTSKPDRY